MKMKRNLIILGVVAALAIAFVIAAPMLKPAESPSPSPTATEDTSRLIISALTSDKVSEVTVENAKETYTVLKSGENFYIKGRESLKLDSTSANSVFYNVANITAEMIVAENVADLSPYGLDKPQAKAHAKYTDGATATFLIGNETAAGNAYYFMKEGDSRVVTVWMNIGNTYINAADTLLAKQALTLTQEEVTGVKVAKDGATVLELTSQADISSVSITSWTITQPWKRTVDTEELDTYLQSIFALSIGSVVEGQPADLAKYGLDKPKYELTLNGAGKTDDLLIGSDKDDYSTYMKFAGSPMVYTVSRSSLDFLSTSAYKLMDKMIILVNIPSALGVEFSGLGQQADMVIEQVPDTDDKGEIRKDSNGETMYNQKFTVDGKEIPDDAARMFYQACIGLSTHSQIDPNKAPSQGVAPIATLTYTRNKEPKEIKVEFLPYDADFYAVRYDGGVNFLIKKAKLQEVADMVVKLKDGTLSTASASPSPSLTPAATETAAPVATAAPTAAPVAQPDNTGGTVMLVLILAGVVVAGVLLMLVMRKKK